MVTDEALIAETAVWPNFFMNVFFALKGSKLFTIIIWFRNIKRNTVSNVDFDVTDMKGTLHLCTSKQSAHFVPDCTLMLLIIFFLLFMYRSLL